MTTLDRKISKKSSVDRIKLLVKTAGLKSHVTKKVTCNISPRVVDQSKFETIYVSLRKRDNENDQNKDHKKRWLLCRSING